MTAYRTIDPNSAEYLSAELHRSTVITPSDGPPPRYWTTREIKVLRELYPKGGVMLAAANLPGRTIGAVFQHARKERLSSPRSPSAPRTRWTTTPHIDEVICRTYQGKPYRGMLRELAAKVMRPEAWVQNRAERLGVVVPRFKELPWSSSEINILHRLGKKSPDTIRIALRRAGFRRTTTAIIVKMKRLRINRIDEEDDRLSARGLAELMGVNPKTVTAWIDRGFLAATDRNAKGREAGGAVEWRIRLIDVRRFIVENVAAFDLRKVDKFWFVDLLATRPAELSTSPTLIPKSSALASDHARWPGREMA